MQRSGGIQTAEPVWRLEAEARHCVQGLARGSLEETVDEEGTEGFSLSR